jgi:hypothetical protein
MKFRFFSRKQGWVNADDHIVHMKVFISNEIEIESCLVDQLSGLTGNEILSMNIDNTELNSMAKTFNNWHFYPTDTKIGCITHI